MSTKGLLELEARNVRSLMTYGIGLTVAGGLALVLAPYGVILGPTFAVGGIVTVVQAFRKRRDVRRRLAAAG
jgi:hypothetical protein